MNTFACYLCLLLTAALICGGVKNPKVGRANHRSDGGWGGTTLHPSCSPLLISTAIQFEVKLQVEGSLLLGSSRGGIPGKDSAWDYVFDADGIILPPQVKAPSLLSGEAVLNRELREATPACWFLWHLRGLSELLTC